MSSNSANKLVYGPDDTPRTKRDAILYSAQWIMIMFYPVVWGYSIVGKGLGFEGQDLCLYMTRVVFVIGASTLLQALFGHRLAMISGPNIIPSLAIVAACSVGGADYALESFNAFIIAGIIVAILSALGIMDKIGSVWTPLVSGAMILMVGLSTSTTGVSLVASDGFSMSFALGIGLALFCGWLSIKGRGLIATVPVLITIVIGYLAFIALGKFDWGLVASMPVFTIPQLFPYGISLPPIDLIVTMTVVTIFASANAYGNVEGYSEIVDAKQTEREHRRTFTIFGLIEHCLTGALGAPPTAPYGENLGFVLLTRVASRFFLICASIACIAMSFFGTIGGVMAAMPESVAGAVLIGVACTLIGIGARTMVQAGAFNTREIFIVGFSVFLALGTSFLPDSFFSETPRLVSTLLKNPVIMVIILTVIMEQLVMRKPQCRYAADTTSTACAENPPRITNSPDETK